MKVTLAILICMVVLAALVPIAAVIWGLWSLTTILLTVAVLGFELTLSYVLARHIRAQQHLVRFGAPLQHKHFPMHYGPLPGSPTARRQRSAPPESD